jgi:hypothetical protein
MDARLGRLRNRIAVSQAVADHAARHHGARCAGTLGAAVPTAGS